jgi:Holliday junction resolvase-like predicted endonuclease
MKITENIKNSTVTRETYKNPKYNPLNNVHTQKLRRLSRVIQVYLVSHETKWQFDVITVKIDQVSRIGRVEHIKDIII